jgi:outer membrane protein OmpA-like peptidoglycan-associated protein
MVRYAGYALMCALLGALLPLRAPAQDWSNVDEYKKRGDRWAEEQKKRRYEVQKSGEVETPGDIEQAGTMQVAGDISVAEADCQKRLSVGADTLFEFDKATLTPEAEVTLAELGPMIRVAGNHPVVVEGHTDAVGTDAYNRGLSERRAQAVKRWLVEHGYLPAAALTKGYGESNPVASNTRPDGSDDPEGRRLNRRVVIAVDTCR